MQNKNFLLIAGAAAFFLLGGAEALGGGVSGGGGSKESKSTAITGITPEQPGYPDPVSKKDAVTQPYQQPTPSPYIQEQMNKQNNQSVLSYTSKKVIISTPNNPAPLADQWITARAASGAYGNSGTAVMPNKNILSPLSVQIPKPDPINNFTAKILAPAFPSAGAYSATALSIGTLTGNVVQGTSKKAASTTATSGNNTYSSTPSSGTGMSSGSVSRTIGGVKYYR